MSIPKGKSLKKAFKTLREVSKNSGLTSKAANTIENTEEAIKSVYDKLVDYQYLNFLKDRIKPTIGKKEEQEAILNFDRMLEDNEDMWDMDPDDWNAMNGRYTDNWIKHWSNSGNGGQRYLKKYGGTIKNIKSSERIPMGGMTSAFRHDWLTPINNSKK